MVCTRFDFRTRLHRFLLFPAANEIENERSDTVARQVKNDVSDIRISATGEVLKNLQKQESGNDKKNAHLPFVPMKKGLERYEQAKIDQVYKDGRRIIPQVGNKTDRI